MNFKIVALIISSLALSACGGLNTFHEYARAGDTVAIPVGMQPSFNKDNITVTITPASGPDIILGATDSAIRAIVNLYPDPISNIIVSREIGEDTTPFAELYSDTLLFNTSNDKDYYQTTVFIDLPSSLPIGLTQVNVSEPLGSSKSLSLEIIEGTGTANSFDDDITLLPLNDNMLDSISRAPHVEISFESATIPSAIEVNFTHDPDNTIAGGNGKAFVTNPLGYIKNLLWSDDGINLKIIMTENNPGLIQNIKDYKFYIVGTTTNLQLQSVNSYDNNGNPITGTTALLTSN